MDGLSSPSSLMSMSSTGSYDVTMPSAEIGVGGSESATSHGGGEDRHTPSPQMISQSGSSSIVILNSSGSGSNSCGSVMSMRGVGGSARGGRTSARGGRRQTSTPRPRYVVEQQGEEDHDDDGDNVIMVADLGVPSRESAADHRIRQREMERKRREKTKEQSARLKSLIPCFSDNSTTNPKLKKANDGIVMERAADYIEELQAELAALRDKAERQPNMEALSRKASLLDTSLAAEKYVSENALKKLALTKLNFDFYVEKYKALCNEHGAQMEKFVVDPEKINTTIIGQHVNKMRRNGLANYFKLKLAKTHASGQQQQQQGFVSIASIADQQRMQIQQLRLRQQQRIQQQVGDNTSQPVFIKSESGGSGAEGTPTIISGGTRIQQQSGVQQVQVLRNMVVPGGTVVRGPFNIATQQGGGGGGATTGQSMLLNPAGIQFQRMMAMKAIQQQQQLRLRMQVPAAGSQQQHNLARQTMHMQIQMQQIKLNPEGVGINERVEMIPNVCTTQQQSVDTLQQQRNIEVVVASGGEGAPPYPVIRIKEEPGVDDNVSGGGGDALPVKTINIKSEPMDDDETERDGGNCVEPSKLVDIKSMDDEEMGSAGGGGADQQQYSGAVQMSSNGYFGDPCAPGAGQFGGPCAQGAGYFGDPCAQSAEQFCGSQGPPGIHFGDPQSFGQFNGHYGSSVDDGQVAGSSRMLAPPPYFGQQMYGDQFGGFNGPTFGDVGACQYGPPPQPPPPPVTTSSRMGFDFEMRPPTPPIEDEFPAEMPGTGTDPPDQSQVETQQPQETDPGSRQYDAHMMNSMVYHNNVFRSIAIFKEDFFWKGYWEKRDKFQRDLNIKLDLALGRAHAKRIKIEEMLRIAKDKELADKENAKLAKLEAMLQKKNKQGRGGGVRKRGRGGRRKR